MEPKLIYALQEFPIGFAKLEAHMDIMPRNAQLPNSRNRFLKSKKTNASRLLRYNNDESTSSDERREKPETEYKFDASNSEKKDTRRQRKRKTKKEG